MSKHTDAMSQFHSSHWEKKPGDVSVANTKYGTEFNQAEDYKRSVDALASYVKKHKPTH